MDYSDNDSDGHDHPPEFIIHAIDDLAPPPPPAVNARAPPGILPPPPPPLPPPYRRPPPPPSDEVTFLRTFFFVFKVYTRMFVTIDQVYYSGCDDKCVHDEEQGFAY
uniref:Uncharacterized protein n=1 Tax=Leersia perrieri TaxID=77586 RepID=A0A0D9WVW3_9ORYZ